MVMLICIPLLLVIYIVILHCRLRDKTTIVETMRIELMNSKSEIEPYRRKSERNQFILFLSTKPRPSDDDIENRLHREGIQPYHFMLLPLSRAELKKELEYCY